MSEVLLSEIQSGKWKPTTRRSWEDGLKMPTSQTGQHVAQDHESTTPEASLTDKPSHIKTQTRHIYVHKRLHYCCWCLYIFAMILTFLFFQMPSLAVITTAQNSTTLYHMFWSEPDFKMVAQILGIPPLNMGPKDHQFSFGFTTTCHMISSKPSAMRKVHEHHRYTERLLPDHWTSPQNPWCLAPVQSAVGGSHTADRCNAGSAAVTHNSRHTTGRCNAGSASVTHNSRHTAGRCNAGSAAVTHKLTSYSTSL